MSPSSGTRLGPYEIIQPIGKGGMGEVFKAVDTRLDRQVAIKISSQAFSERFEREAHAIAALNHPNICTLFDIGQNYLVMELVDGKPLTGPLPADDALRYAGQICDALDHAHRQGIVHRDLKPANILLTRKGIKLLDFGLAHVPHDASSTTLPPLTRTGVAMGTPGYMAPEQWEGKTADARSDIYAFGCVLYELLTGLRPQQDRKPLPSASLEAVVRRCLEKDPDDRWQSAHDIKYTLDILTVAHANLAAPRQSRVRTWQWVAAAAVAAISLGAWSLRPSAPSAEDVLSVNSQIPLPGNGTIAAGNFNTLAVSPDGSAVAFVAEVNQETGVWVRVLKRESADLVAGSRGAQFVIWSPDSKSVAFRVGTELLRYDLGSSAPVVIAPMALGPTFGADWIGGSDGPDAAKGGTILIGGTSGIVRVSGFGGTPVPVGVTEGTHPVLLPGGRFLYTSSENQGSVRGASLDHPDQAIEILKEATLPVYVARDVGNGERGNGAGYLLWIRGTTLLAREFDPRTLTFAGTETVLADPAWAVAASPRRLLYDPVPTKTQLAQVDMSGSVQSRIGEVKPFLFMALSHLGDRVVVTVATNSGINGGGLLIADTTQRGAFNPLAADLGSDTAPVWSFDDRFVIFGTNTGLASVIADGVAPARHIHKYKRRLNPTDSKNGFALFTQVGTDGKLDLMMVPMAPDGTTAGTASVYNAHVGAQTGARFSPDGNWVAYESDESDNRNEIFVDSFPIPRGAVRVSRNGGFGVRWNPLSGELFYRSLLDNKLMSVAIQFDKKAIPSEPKPLFTMPVSANGNLGQQYDVYPDGKHFLIPQPVKKDPLKLIADWQKLLKK